MTQGRRAFTVPPLSPSVVDCAYAGGFFDGEGHISIAASDHRRYGLTLSASQLVPGPLEWLQARWGGHLYLNRGPIEARRGHPLFYWRASARQALTFLLDVRPFLQVKATQADVAIAWQSARGRQGRFQTAAQRQAVIDGGRTAHLRLIEIRKGA